MGRWDSEDKSLYYDGMKVRDGKVIDPHPIVDTRNQVTAIKKYVDGYMTALDSGDVPPPNGGDCWDCLMLHKDSAKDTTGHITSHMDEGYYVPSLVVNAIKMFPVSQAAQWYLGAIWNDETVKRDFFTSIERKQIKKSLLRYIKRQLGIVA